MTEENDLDGHNYFMFDVCTSEASKDDNYILIDDWQGEATQLSQVDTDRFNLIQLWASHDFIKPHEEQKKPPNATEVGHFKTHTSSMTLRVSELPFYTTIKPQHDNYEVSGVGFYVTLPDNLSSRQKEWLDLIEPPKLKQNILLTTKEYRLLCNVKVLSKIHAAKPIHLYKIKMNETPLTQKIKSRYSAMAISLACLNPEVTLGLSIDYTWWLANLNVKADSEYDMYNTHAKYHMQLSIRNERINQINAIIYTHYYTNLDYFISGDVHKIDCGFIIKRAIRNQEDLRCCVYAADGWFNVAYAPHKLTTALVVMATVGYWAVENSVGDEADLLITTVESFASAAKNSDDIQGSVKLYKKIHNPQNPFDLRAELFKHNIHMPYLAEICGQPRAVASNIASYITGEGCTKLFNDSIDTNEHVESIISKFV